MTPDKLVRFFFQPITKTAWLQPLATLFTLLTFISLRSSAVWILLQLLIQSPLAFRQTSILSLHPCLSISAKPNDKVTKNIRSNNSTPSLLVLQPELTTLVLSTRQRLTLHSNLPQPHLPHPSVL